MSESQVSGVEEAEQVFQWWRPFGQAMKSKIERGKVVNIGVGELVVCALDGCGPYFIDDPICGRHLDFLGRDPQKHAKAWVQMEETLKNWGHHKCQGCDREFDLPYQAAAHFQAKHIYNLTGDITHPTELRLALEAREREKQRREWKAKGFTPDPDYYRKHPEAKKK